MSKTSGLVLVVALCTHSIFEGMALGIQKDLTATAFLFLSIAIHNFVASVSLGGNFVRSGFSFGKATCLMFSFAISTSIGVAIGLGLTEASPLVSSIFLAISTGTFIYVSCTEIIQSEFERGYREWLQFIFVCLGGGFIIALFFVNQGHHDHGIAHDDHHDH